MSFGNDIGPKEVTIPEQKFYSCFGCKFYDHHMVRSGQHPIYETVCRAMNMMGEEIKDGEINFTFYHLHDKKTPDCCPYLKSVKRNDAIDKIL